ncbi:MAG: CRTAC1 family protein [Bryobacterales bacterium]|nr:CRTAC1 family protein [Bryobacterales bacterium]
MARYLPASLAVVASFGFWWIASLPLGRVPAAGQAVLSATGQVAFREVGAEAGIGFVHENAASPEKYLIETMGGGAAWLDFDGDGWLDLYLTNSAATEAFQTREPLGGVLYRNLAGDRFEDVTGQAGVGAHGLFAMGVAVGDYDNDGDPDLAVTGYGRSVLFRNEGDGTFADVTHIAGLANQGKWGSSAAWFDFDKDGLLDLVVVNYLDWSPENNLHCGELKPGYRSYCHPNKYQGQKPALYRNSGGGRFENVSEVSTLGAKPGNGLGVVCFDFDLDGWTDVFIANDSMENFLFRNLGDGSFEETAFLAGVALGENGQAEAGMGVDAGDYDNDGRPDLYITHLDYEFDRLYRNERQGEFSDATFEGGIGYKTFDLSGFGTRFVDVDNDGWLDLFVANGHVLDNIELFHEGTRYAERKLLFRNRNGKFEEVGAASGEALSEPRVSRAAAFADYDNDGDVDVLVANNGQPPQLLRNEGGNARNWLQVALVGAASSRDGIGATVTVRSGGRFQVMQRTGGGSYQAAHDPRMHFGLGSAPTVAAVEVRWPSDAVDTFTEVPSNRVLTVREGASGSPQSAAAADPSRQH